MEEERKEKEKGVLPQKEDEDEWEAKPQVDENADDFGPAVPFSAQLMNNSLKYFLFLFLILICFFS